MYFLTEPLMYAMANSLSIFLEIKWKFYIKKPSMVANVNYKEVIDELYSTKISDDENENKQLQKTVANTIIGLLEKIY